MVEFCADFEIVRYKNIKFLFMRKICNAAKLVFVVHL